MKMLSNILEALKWVLLPLTFAVLCSLFFIMIAVGLIVLFATEMVGGLLSVSDTLGSRGLPWKFLKWFAKDVNHA